MFLMLKAGSVLSVLREETGEAHRRLETRMDAIARLAEPETRNDLVRRYHRFHQAVEAAVAPLAADLDLDDWRRLPLIEEALATLGLAPLPAAPLALANREQALGALYVLEGSALGGRVILKDLAGRGADRTGLDFLDPHGAEVGEAWRAFIAVLENQVSDPSQAAAGALAAFAHAQNILCTEEAA